MFTVSDLRKTLDGLDPDLEVIVQQESGAEQAFNIVSVDISKQTGKPRNQWIGKKQAQVRDQIGVRVWDQVRDQVWAQVRVGDCEDQVIITFDPTIL